MRRLALLLCSLAAACTGDVGTIRLNLVSAPGTDPLADAVLARLRLSSPATEVEVELDGSSVLLDLDIEARNRLATISFEAEDSSGDIVARGQTPPLPLNVIDFELAIYVAAPWGVAEAPVELSSARRGLGGAALSFGAALFGGIEDDGTVSTEMRVYNAFQHEFQDGASMPEGRAFAASIADGRGLIYIFGGVDAQGDDRSAGFRFDTRIAPAGAYSDLQANANLARSNADLLPLGLDRYLLTGAPLAVIDGVEGTASPLTGGANMGGPGAAITIGDDLLPTAVLIGADTGESGAVMVRETSVTPLEAPDEALRIGHRVVAIDDRVLVIGGADSLDTLLTSGVTFTGESEAFEIIDDVLDSPRRDHSVATTNRHILIAGGTDQLGQAMTSIEVLDRATLQHVATLDMAVPRIQPTLVALDNGQVLIAGGTTDIDEGTAVVELFTPGDE